MVSLVTSALAGVFGGATAAFPAAPGLAAVAASPGTLGSVLGVAPATATAGLSSGVLTALQGFAAGLTALGQIGAANAQAKTLTNQATEAKLEAGQEQVSSVQRQTAMKRELARVLGQNSVTFAAAGIDLAGGMAADAATAAKQRAAEEMSIDSRDSEFRAALLRMRARGLIQTAESTRGAGLLAALGTGAGFGISLAGRG